MVLPVVATFLISMFPLGSADAYSVTCSSSPAACILQDISPQADNNSLHNNIANAVMHRLQRDRPINWLSVSMRDAGLTVTCHMDDDLVLMARGLSIDHLAPSQTLALSICSQLRRLPVALDAGVQERLGTAPHPRQRPAPCCALLPACRHSPSWESIENVKGKDANKRDDAVWCKLTAIRHAPHALLCCSHKLDCRRAVINAL